MKLDANSAVLSVSLEKLILLTNPKENCQLEIAHMAPRKSANLDPSLTEEKEALGVTIASKCVTSAATQIIL